MASGASLQATAAVSSGHRNDTSTKTTNSISGAWAGLFYLSLYLTGKLHLLDSRGEVWKTFVVLIPSLGAALIAGSRIMDARHHPFDVITGSMLGIVCAWAAYRQYFPPLHDFRAKGRAYPIRTWGRISEDYVTQPTSMDRLPLKTGASDMGYGPGRDESPGASTGNVFRDEMNSRQRRRTDEEGASSMAPPPNYASQYASSNPYGGATSRRRDEWDESSDEESRRGDVELQPQQRRYDPPASSMDQDTSYTSYKPPPAQALGQPSRPSGEGAGDIGVAHGHPRGVTLTESYAK